MSLVEDLEAVKARLLTKGWIKGRNEDEEGRCCLSGAIHRVASDGKTWVEMTNPEYTRNLHRLDALWDTAIVPAVYRRGETSLIHFNDHIAKTVDDVIAVIDDAIAHVA